MTKKELDKKFKYYDRKINSLWSKNQKIEALLYMSILVEFFVKQAILNFEKIIEGIAFEYHIGFNPRNLYSKNDLENQPLGYLIKILNTYTKNKNLIKNLKHFSSVRNKCVHKLLEHEVKVINKELKEFNRFYYKLVIELLQLNLNQLNMADKSFYNICDECFKKALPNQVKL